MTFLTALALFVAVLVVAPYVAHRLRRRRAEEIAFPPASLVAPWPPEARRRSRLEDTSLFATRTAAVVGLALLGATPFVHCSRLSLQRSSGASVAIAIVLDDSMSMRAPLDRTTRFERARSGASQLLASAREGDAVALVLAGAPARVALAATTDLAAARRAVDDARPTDRATDLEGAVVLARDLVGSAAQVDRRVVVLSDLADGQSAGAPLGEGGSPPVWVALPDLRAAGADCAILRADQIGQRVTVVTSCGPGGSLAGREVIIEDGPGKVLGSGAPASAGPPETRITLADSAAPAARARLTGTDAIASDDVAPVVTGAGRGSIAIVADPSDESVVTGGPPIVEQALSALELDIDLRALPALPDRAEELTTALGVVLDDPPGMTPEQRHTLEAFLEKGGVVLATLGPHAAAAPLGATLQPILAHGVVWSSGPGGAHLEVDTKSALSGLVGTAGNLDGLDAARRATLAPDDAARFEALVKWTDGAPLVARRTIGRGEAWVITLPMSVEASDLPLRASFLGLLSGWIRTARDHASPVRTDVATPWKFPGAARLEATGPDGLLTASRDGAELRLVPEVAGAYEVRVDGRIEHRVAAPIARELDLRPRAATAGTGAEKGLRDTAAVDASGPVALALLALMALELGLRLRARTGPLPQAGSAG